jgi:uncharacterized membrane protein (UPF0127 family)
LGFSAARRWIGCLTAVLTIGAGAAYGDATCAIDKIDLQGSWGKAQFTIEVADDAQERGVGLMNRPSMARSAGMLFIYEEVSDVAFWMENTLIPLDMLFIDETGVITDIHENAIPLDRTTIPADFPVLGVLEINGGLSAQLGINVGTKVRHGAFDPATAAWPCDSAN